MSDLHPQYGPFGPGGSGAARARLTGVHIYSTNPSEPVCPARGCGHPKGDAIPVGWTDWFGGGFIYECALCGAEMLDDDGPGGCDE